MDFVERHSVSIALGFVLLIVGMGVWTQHVINSHAIIVTERDIVRWCDNSRRRHDSAKEIKYYCTELGGDEFITKGFTPNYEQYPWVEELDGPAPKSGEEK